MSKVIILWFPYTFNFVKSLARFVGLMTLLWLLSVMCWFSILVRCLANLYDGTDLLLITGWTGMPYRRLSHFKHLQTIAM